MDSRKFIELLAAEKVETDQVDSLFSGAMNERLSQSLAVAKVSIASEIMSEGMKDDMKAAKAGMKSYHTKPADVEKMQNMQARVAKVAKRLGKKEADVWKKANEEAEQIDEVSRKHFQQVADLIKEIPDEAKRKELAQHHAGIFKSQNPRFDHSRFYAAAGVKMDEETELSEGQILFPRKGAMHKKVLKTLKDNDIPHVHDEREDGSASVRWKTEHNPKVKRAIQFFYNAQKQNEETLQELRKSTLASYIGKAARSATARSRLATGFGRDVGWHLKQADKRSAEGEYTSAGIERKAAAAAAGLEQDFTAGAAKRVAGIKLAAKKLAKEETLNERNTESHPKLWDTHSLKHDSGKILEKGVKVKDFRGDTHTIQGFELPHREGSTGRVYTDKGSFFPGVVNAKIVKRDKHVSEAAVESGAAPSNRQRTMNVIRNLRRATQTLGVQGVNPNVAARAHDDYAKVASKNPRAPGYMLLRKLSPQKAQAMTSLMQSGVPLGGALEANPADFQQVLQRMKRLK